MNIRSEYLSRGKRNHVHDRPAQEQKLREQRVCRFLAFCESQESRRIREIQQVHFDQFVDRLHKANASIWTIYKYKLAIEEFVKLWRLPIRIKPDRGKMLFKQRQKIERALERATWLTQEQRLELMNLIMGVL